MFQIRTVVSSILSGTFVVIFLAMSPATAVPDIPATAVAEPAHVPGEMWQFPVDVSPEVLRPFDPPSMPWGAGHRGVDIRADKRVLAPADGTVHFVGWVVNRPVLSLRHDAVTLSSFEPIDSTLQIGDEVSRGDVIGEISDDHSHCATTCLHWGVRVDGEYVNPLDFVQRVTIVLLE